MRTFAYLIAGHIVSLLDDINLVQEAGRNETHTQVFKELMPICPRFLSHYTAELDGNDSVKVIGRLVSRSFACIGYI